jgi:hypothetical protein
MPLALAAQRGPRRHVDGVRLRRGVWVFLPHLDGLVSLAPE